MGNITGFKTYDRALPKNEAAKNRVQHFKEFTPEGSSKLLKEQSARCMDCGIPFCHSACPLGNLIPEFNDAVYNDDYKRAYELLIETNNFPEFTGRICPAPCEGSCVLGINKSPVSIEYIEKSIIEKAFQHKWVKPLKVVRTGKSVAIVGSGPAGLACADQLNKGGHSVKVYEKSSHPGGLLRYGIPDFKLDKKIVERRIKLMEKEGITFINDTEIGKDISLVQLKKENDAVILCGGSERPRDLKIKGRGLDNIHFAMDFLTECNKNVQSKEPMTINVKGKKVMVIGGGDTGSDCIGNSNRMGAASVTQIELFPMPPDQRAIDNPWPLWPKVLKVSSSHEEGCDREWAINTKTFVGHKDKSVAGLEVVDLEWSKDDKGQYNMNEIPGSLRILEADIVFLAMGFIQPYTKALLDKSKIKLTSKGTIQESDYQTSDKKIFTAGDMRRGQSLVVWAINEGRECAEQVESFLSEM